LGGAAALLGQRFYIGINDVFGGDPTGAGFNNVAMTLFTDVWASAGDDDERPQRYAIVRGQALFNTLDIPITGVAGINDNPAIGSPPVVHGFCTSCHDSPNVGDHSLVAPLNIGISDASRRTPDMPLYTLTCNTGPHAGEVYQTTDPGRALISGHCADIGKFKGPILRNLTSRAPYFHNGFAKSLDEVLAFYDTRFSLGLTDEQRSDLAAFLAAL
jgi:hypothetical protein